MQVSLFYFSGTGNTWWATDYFSNIARGKGIEVEVIPIEENPDIESFWLRARESCAKNVDLRIGFAFPIYAASIPSIMQKFLERLMKKKEEICPNLQIPVFSISTVGYINAYGPFRLHKFLQPSGMQLHWALVCRLGNNISTPELRSPVANPKKVKKLQLKSEKKLNHFLNEIQTKPKKYHGIGPWLLGGYFVPKILGSHVKQSYRNFSVDQTRCISCMCCVNSCPEGAIKFHDGAFQFLNTCTACMRCYTYCPTYAILRSNIFADPKKYPRFRLPDKAFQKLYWSNHNQ